MLKRLTLIAALCLPAFAGAVDITVTLSTADAARVLTAVGKAQSLVDSNGSARAATQAEAKAFLAQRLQQLIIDTEGKALTDAAVKAVVVPTFTVQ